MNNGRILILGKGGQLSGALMALLGSRALAIGQEQADFLDHQFIAKIEHAVSGKRLSAVINAAAYTQVDLAESTGREAAFRINATAVNELALWCKKVRVPLVHFSSDYVFDGTSGRAWREDDPPHPINTYGQSKLAGERLLAEHGGAHLLFRTSWLYDAHGKNFFTTMRRLMAERESLNVVSDQIGAPTYVPHLAKAVLSALTSAMEAKLFPSGLYHLCSGGETSWFEFAHAIFEYEQKLNPSMRCTSVHPIPTTAYPLPAKRPLNSRLDCHRVRERFGIAMPDWQEGLKECYQALQAL